MRVRGLGLGLRGSRPSWQDLGYSLAVSMADKAPMEGLSKAQERVE